MFLITTADERSWKFDGEEVLCLGTWCRLYDRAQAWKKLNAKVVPYHWDDRKKLYQDYLYLRDLHEVLLVELTKELNRFHQTEFSVRYWRILIGPWLLYFTQMLFDRWSMIKLAENNYQITGTSILDFPLGEMTPTDMVEFRNLYISEEWNHYLYAQILTGWTSISYEKISNPHTKIKQVDQSSNAPKSFRYRVADLISRASQLFTGKNALFLISTHLPFKKSLLLQIAMKQFPLINTQQAAPRVPFNFHFRQDFKLDSNLYLNAEKNFEHCLRTLIPLNMPTIYLEGYQSLQSICKKLSWPQKPKAIFTSSSYNADDVFKAWTACKVEQGTPLLIGQHGGNLGSALWTSSEDHEVAISDRYLTWGWSDQNKKKYPAVALKQIGLKSPKWNAHGPVLLVSSVMPRYSYVMGSFTVGAGQVESNLEDQYQFIRALPKNIAETILVRLFTPDWNWGQVQRWQDELPQIKIDSGEGPIGPLMKSARLYVATYNATTFLESMGLNIPTIIFWNPEHWELRPEALPYFQRLQEVGIFHETPESAAQQVAKIWNDIEAWWRQEERQKIRQEFCDRFVCIKEEPLKILKVAIDTVSTAAQNY